MSVLFVASMIITITVLLIDFLLVLLSVFHLKKYNERRPYQPKVTILVAARNEEENIEECIRSLLGLDYPKHKYEILVGDDHSSDKTFEILEALSNGHKHVKVYSVHKNMGNAKGKANVLAHLARAATGDFYFITDADCIVNRDWIQTLLTAHEKGVGIVIGTTGVPASWQGIEWLFALGMLKVINDLRLPVTAMGNNMYITKEAYLSVGGYESIPFSITEDYELFKQVSKQGYTTRHVVAAGSHVMTKPAMTMTRLMHQRKRWMQGAVQLPAPIVLLLLLQALYYPALLYLFIESWVLGLAVFTFKSLLQMFLILRIGRRVRSRISWVKLIFYEFYAAFISLLSSVYYILPVKIEWKGRKY